MHSKIALNCLAQILGAHLALMPQTIRFGGAFVRSDIASVAWRISRSIKEFPHTSINRPAVAHCISLMIAKGRPRSRYSIASSILRPKVSWAQLSVT